MWCILRTMEGMLLFWLWFPAGFMVLLTWAVHRWPPNSKNPAYGYRTLQSMASPEAWDYAQKRSISLLTHWTWWMVAWTPVVWWRWGVETGSLVTCMLMTLGVLLPLFYVERELKKGMPYASRGGVHGIAAMVSLVMLMSVFKPITHDGSEPERTVCGTLDDMSWNLGSEDVFLRLRNDPCHYYINRGLGMGVDTLRWHQALMGREVCLEVVDRPAGLNWFEAVGPVRGVIVANDTLYRTGHVRNP